MREFVAEQYLSGSNAAAAQRSAAAAARVASERLAAEGTAVEFVRSIFIPEDETCMYIYAADSIESVRAAAARSSLQFERICAAVTEVGTTRGKGGASK